MYTQFNTRFSFDVYVCMTDYITTLVTMNCLVNMNGITIETNVF